MNRSRQESATSVRAVFLDRDGVLNRAIVRDGKPYPPQTVEELEILPGVVEALNQLKSAGFKCYVVTNQPDVARGKQTRDMVERINAKLCEALPLDGFYVCYHDDHENCLCRKPRPGLLQQAALEHGIDILSSVMIGDRWRDIEAGQAARCKTVWIKMNYREREPSNQDLTTGSLRDAVKWIVALQNTQSRAK